MIQVIHRAFDILEFVARQGKEPVQLLKIAKNAGLSQPTTANIVKSLVEKNYLEQVGRKVGYRLGIAAYQLASNASYDQDLLAAVKEPMKELTGQLKETSLIAVLRNNKRVIVHLEECDQMLQVKPVRIGEVYNTSTGRLLAAYLTSKELDNLVKAVGLPSKKTWPGTETKERLEKELKKIREQEFVQITSIHHTVGFAVPVYKGKQVIAGLSVFIPESRYTPVHKDTITKQIRRTAKKIQKLLEGKAS